jgi:aldehyde dehydrogenase (NAD+)
MKGKLSGKSARKKSKGSNTKVLELSGAVSVAEKAALPAKNRELRFGNKWEYAPAQEAADYIKIPPRQELFINGQFVQPHSGKYFPSINPANEELLGEVATADESDVDKAVQAARTAYENVWSKISALERGKYLYRIARLIQEKARELAVLESMDGGKPIKESRDVDLPLAAAHFFYYAGWADKLKYAFPGRAARP